MCRINPLIILFFIFILTGKTVSADTPTVRISVLKFGTVMWELETIKRYRLDTKNGFNLEINPVANKQAAAILLQTGDTDAIVSDWLWAARQWEKRRFAVLPYSSAVGGIIVSDPKISTVADLKGKRIAVAGGPLDKNWLLLRAFAKQQYNFDPLNAADIVFASPPIVHQKMLLGEFDAAINFWHYLARAKAKGLRFLATTDEMSLAAGLDNNAPLLAYIFKHDWAQKHPDLVRSFATSSRAAKLILASDNAAWEALKPRMKLKAEKEFEELRAGFLAGIPNADGWPKLSAMQSIHSFLKNNGGEKLIGNTQRLSSQMFLSGHE